MKTLFSIALIGILFSSSCTKEEDHIAQGVKPLYTSNSLLGLVESQEAKSFEKVGKIFIKGNRIYISDIGSGVHIIDNTIPSTPVKQAFISIYGNNDMAVKDNVMFADNSSSLLAIDISDINNVTVSKQIEDVYNEGGQFFPSDHIGFFECVDTEKGFVYDWVTAELVNPKCRR